MSVFANHAHLMPGSVRPDASVEDLLRLMDACGIDRAVCFAPFDSQARQGDIGDPHLWLADEIEGRDRLIGFACLNPALPASLEALPRVRDLGFRGVKLHPAHDAFDVLNPAALDFYAAAASLGLALDFHTGVHQSPLRDWEMIKFDEIAWKIPSLRLILEHVGGIPFFPTALAIIVNHFGEDGPRVYAGCTTLLNPAVRLWYLGEEQVERLAYLAGNETLIYGLDFPYNTREVVCRELDIYRSLDLGPGGQEALLGGNLSRLLGEPRG